MGAEGAAEHLSRCPGPWHCPIGAAGTPREALPRAKTAGAGRARGEAPFNEQLVTWPPFRAWGLILPAGASQPRSVVAKLGRDGLVQRSGPLPWPLSVALHWARCSDGAEVPAGRESWRPRHTGVNRAVAGRSSLSARAADAFQASVSTVLN